MECNNDALLVQFNDAATLRLIGVESHHCYFYIQRALGMPGYESRNIKPGQVIGMSDQKRAVSKERAILKYRSAGAQQLVFMRQGDGIAPFRYSDKRANCIGKIMRVNQNPVYPVGHEQIKPVTQQGLPV